jgi:hypothetical protein
LARARKPLALRYHQRPVHCHKQSLQRYEQLEDGKEAKDAAERFCSQGGGQKPE